MISCPSFLFLNSLFRIWISFEYAILSLRRMLVIEWYFEIVHKTESSIWRVIPTLIWFVNLLDKLPCIFFSFWHCRSKIWDRRYAFCCSSFCFLCKNGVWYSNILVPLCCMCSSINRFYKYKTLVSLKFHSLCTSHLIVHYESSFHSLLWFKLHAKYVLFVLLCVAPTQIAACWIIDLYWS